MNKFILILVFVPGFLHAQSFHPAPGNPGTNAIGKDSSCFVSWASGGTVTRGYLNIADTTIVASGSNKASYGNLNLALGPATGSITDVLSLGDSGVATLSFDQFIMDGPGYDFAVFENGFTDDYLEMAHVEVSSDGIHFFRFPSTTEIPLTPQSSNASYTDCRMIDNLAGKFRLGYGTPFDLSDLPNDPDLNKSAVTLVRIIDVIGSISGHVTTDQYGTVINDPYPTAFESGGFDLEAIGIINGTLGLTELELLEVHAFPNPTTDQLQVTLAGRAYLNFYSPEGRLLLALEHTDSSHISLHEFAAGVYHLLVTQNGKQRHLDILKK
ncbi:T9SS type A sorting domain-containing protein [Fluviicola chungangensis]|uniref:T9SS type A sorting domain-containing protein n=1 Tax=Fluviicola chungangensis TaxID=2597671 RepID=A0A556N7Q3_9FLAO|nr:T9SS type A sorting domain-containing protein [Fluviicola chungangensis]TSJ48206.1 T9SS type A sorting domain-containing protein [Fluviicola chungangensis]